MDGLPDADIGAAATDVAVHGRVDVRIGRLADARKQAHRRHDLPRLAVAALNDIEPLPGRANSVGNAARDCLDGDDFLAGGVARGHRARPHRLTVDVHRARPALRTPASVFGAGQIELVAQDPQYRHVGIDAAEIVLLAVDGELHCRSPVRADRGEASSDSALPTAP